MKVSQINKFAGFITDEESLKRATGYSGPRPTSFFGEIAQGWKEGQESRDSDAEAKTFGYPPSLVVMLPSATAFDRELRYTPTDSELDAYGDDDVLLAKINKMVEEVGADSVWVIAVEDDPGLIRKFMDATGAKQDFINSRSVLLVYYGWLSTQYNPFNNEHTSAKLRELKSDVETRKDAAILGERRSGVTGAVANVSLRRYFYNSRVNTIYTVPSYPLNLLYFILFGPFYFLYKSRGMAFVGYTIFIVLSFGLGYLYLIMAGRGDLIKGLKESGEEITKERADELVATKGATFQ